MKRVFVVLFLLASLLAAIPLPASVSAAPALKSITVNRTTPVVGGTTHGNVTFTVNLTDVAPAAGTRVTVSSSSSKLRLNDSKVVAGTVKVVNGTVVVPAGTKGVSFKAQSLIVSETTMVTVTAKMGSISKRVRLTIVPAGLDAIAARSSLASGATMELEVLLDGPAPIGDYVVTLTSSHPSLLRVPATATVRSGKTSVKVSVRARTTPVDVRVTITGTHGKLGDTVTRTDIVKVLKPVVVPTVAITVVAGTILAGGQARINVCLAATPADTVTFAVSSSNFSVASPTAASLVWIAGSTGSSLCKEVRLTSLAAGTVTLTATRAGVIVRSTLVTVLPHGTGTLSVAPATVASGGATTLSATISRSYPFAICLPVGYDTTGAVTWSGFPAEACVPIAANATSGSVVVTWGAFTPATAYRAGLFWPYWGGAVAARRAAPIATAPVGIQIDIASVALPTSTMRPGSLYPTTVTLAAAAVGNVTVMLAVADTSVATAPATVVVLNGQTSASFNLTAVAGGTTTLRATLGASTKTAPVVVVPTGVAAVVVNPTSEPVFAGGTRSANVQLDGNVSANTVVTLTSSDTSIATVPANVTVDAGGSLKAFEVTIPVAAGAGGTATITATLGASSRSATVTVPPYLVFSVGLPEGSVVEGSDAVVTVSLNTFVETNTVVTLVSSNPAVVAVPATATVLADTFKVDLTRTTLAAGTTTITASLNGGSVSGTLTVTAGPVRTISVLSINGNVVAGSPTNGFVFLNDSIPVTRDTTVSLTSSDTSVATVPETVTIPVRQYSAPIPVTTIAGPGGTVTITATLGASVRTTTLTVRTSIVIPIELTINPPAPVFAGHPATGMILLRTASTEVTTVTLSLDDAGIATVPISVDIPAGDTTKLFTVTTLAGAGGTVVISATLGTHTVTADLTVHPYIVESVAEFGPAEVGLTTSGTVTLNHEVAQDTDVMLDSSDPGVATVPPTVTVLAGQTSAGFDAQALAAGSTTITASLNGSDASATLAVDAPESPYVINTVEVTGPVSAGYPTVGHVSLTTRVVAATTVTLSSSDADIAAVPPSLVIPAEDYTMTFPLTTAVGAGGTVTVTATLGGRSVSTTLVVNPHRVNTVEVIGPVSAGHPTTGTVSLHTRVAFDTTVTIESSDSSLASGPVHVVIPADGYTVTFPVATTAGAGGTATFTATLGASSASGTLTVAPYAVSVVRVIGPVSAGYGTQGTVELNARVAFDTTVTLTSSEPSLASGPTIVVIPAEGYTVTFPVATTAGAGGTATFTATLGASSASGTLTVSPYLITGVSVTSPLRQGSTTTGTVNLNTRVAADTVIFLTAGDGSVAGVPASVTIPPDGYTATFTVTAIGPGTVDIVATSAGNSMSTTVEVTPV